MAVADRPADLAGLFGEARAPSLGPGEKPGWRRWLRWAPFGIAAKLLLAFGALLALFAAMAAVLGPAFQVLRDDIAEVAEVAEPLSAAAYEMEINAIGTGIAVLRYLQKPDPAALARFEKDRRDFQQFHHAYVGLSDDSAVRQFGERVLALYQEYESLGATLIAAKDQEVALFTRFSSAVKEIDELLDIDPPLATSSEARAAAHLRSDLSELFFWLGHYLHTPSAQGRAALQDERGQIKQNLARLGTLRTRVAADSWLGRLSEKTARAGRLLDELLALTQRIDRDLLLFFVLRQQIDDILDESVQVHTLAFLETAKRNAVQHADDSFAVFLAFGLAAAILTTLAFVFLSRAIIRPLRRLAASAEHIGAGALDYRIAIASRDEIGELARSFNTMAEELERASGDREARFRAVVERAADAIAIVDGEGRIWEANRACENLFGHAVGDLKGQPIGRLLSVANGPKQSGEAPAAINWLTPVVGREAAALTKHGHRVPVELSVGAFLQAGRNVFVFSIRDVTERKQALELLQTKSDDLARSNAELEQFAYVASHDMQEPLRAVAGYCGLLKRRYGDRLEPDAQRMIGNINGGVLRLQELINDLLTYSRVGMRGNELTQTDAGRVFAEALGNLQVAIAEANAAVTADALPTVLGDATQLRQLFQNLIGNGIKYRGDEPPRIHVAAEERNGHWHFAVSDNGIGIAPEHHQRIFGIFQRLHNRDEYPGTGIGLAICKKIVERHGGEIWLESAPKRGSTFHFTLAAE